MLYRIVRYFVGLTLLTALCTMLGCSGGGGGDDNLARPTTDLTGTWEGEAKDPGVTGNYFYPIEFTFVQKDHVVTGTSSLPGLARFRGEVDGSVLTIEGTDIYAYITGASDGTGTYEIRGTFTSAGTAGTGTAAGTGGQTATFWLRRISEFGILAGKVATPAFDPVPGTYASAQSVTITCATAGATIRYTLDGATPTDGSPLYSTPISISQTRTLKARAFKTGLNASDVASGTYTL